MERVRQTEMIESKKWRETLTDIERDNRLNRLGEERRHTLTSTEREVPIIDCL